MLQRRSLSFPPSLAQTISVGDPLISTRVQEGRQLEALCPYIAERPHPESHGMGRRPWKSVGKFVMSLVVGSLRTDTSIKGRIHRLKCSSILS